MPNGSNTAHKAARMGRGVPFVKGDDPRRNLKGRPKAFDHYHALAQKISDEELTLQDGRKITVGEAVLRSWAKSKEPALQKLFADYAFGKVPDKVHMADGDGEPLKPMLIQVITPAAVPSNARVN